ncbi:MAG: hypothetical protein LBF12_06500 [Christensenellaceae bacterium]|jgi:hypothetical protein|nr:hypothetical protein [Christensenellaceae bacterium]
MNQPKSLANIATTPYNSHLLKLALNVVYFTALIMCVIFFEGGVFYTTPLFSIFTVIAGITLFFNIIKIDVFVAKLNQKLKLYFYLSWIPIILALIFYLLYCIKFTNEYKIIAIIISCVGLITNAFLEIKTIMFLKSDKNYLGTYANMVMEAFQEYSSKNKTKDKEGSLDVSTLALIGYLVLFITVRGGLSLIRVPKQTTPVLIAMIVLLIGVFVIQFLTCKRMYQDTGKFLKRYIAFVQLTLITAICAVTVVLLLPAELELAQWGFTILMSLTYAPFYLAAHRCGRYINAVRISVYLSLLDSEGNVPENLQ